METNIHYSLRCWFL